MTKTAYLLAAGLLWAGLSVTAASAGEGCGAGPCAAAPACGVAGCTDPGNCHHCARCGCGDGCLVCRLVPTDKKIKVDCFAAECKPLCLPCPSHKGCRHVECVDCSKDCNGNQKKVVWFDWCPGDAKVHTPKVLLKKTVEKKVPSYKWVVENLCDGCQKACEQQSVPAPQDAPPAPRVGAKILHGVPNAAVAAVN
jgi:hypothetical protein